MTMGAPVIAAHGTLTAWLAIAFVAALAVAGEVLMAAGLQRLGDLDVIRARSGLPGAIRAVLGNATFVLGALCMALNFFAMLFALSIAQLSLAAPRHWRAHLYRQRGGRQVFPARKRRPAPLAGHAVCRHWGDPAALVTTRRQPPHQPCAREIRRHKALHATRIPHDGLGSESPAADRALHR